MTAWRPSCLQTVCRSRPFCRRIWMRLIHNSLRRFRCLLSCRSSGRWLPCSRASGNRRLSCGRAFAGLPALTCHLRTLLQGFRPAFRLAFLLSSRLESSPACHRTLSFRSGFCRFRLSALANRIPFLMVRDRRQGCRTGYTRCPERHPALTLPV